MSNFIQEELRSEQESDLDRFCLTILGCCGFGDKILKISQIAEEISHCDPA